MSITRQELLEVVNRHITQRWDLIEQGLCGNKLQLADYMTVYNEVKNNGSLEEILTLIFEIFEVSEPRIDDIPKEIRPVAIECISGLFEILENDYTLVGQLVSLMIQSVNHNPDFLVKNALESATLDRNYNQLLLQLEARAIIEPKNDIQLVHQLAKLYADTCEGVYNIAILILSFHVNILRDKPRTIQNLLNTSLTDRINMIKSFDTLLGENVSKPYYSIIRNAAAHEGIDLSLFPPKIKMTDSRNKNKGREMILTLSELESFQISLTSLSNAILRSVTIKGMHPSFLKNVVSKVDMCKIAPLIDMDNVNRRFEN